ncbi:DUF3817 domain-containing protein [Fuerstiella marisgermanici]|uniref:Integral membrane protein n=1 Tax=Fuerstiella marisgermanici TaxID=1891926 RepID=A0A1P8WJJ2_9PLAN|nr:DUF3817 domain-containing protein [Fuerstiella marisgermanici]APZ94207.1 integral membrane protein [Fuerstiella marisgermanici]
MPAINQPFLNKLRTFSIIEGISTLVLFGIAMPLKYLAEMPLAVRIVGSIHGVLFVGLVFMLMAAVSRVPISKGLAITGILAAIVPFGPFIFDGKLKRIGNMAELSE